MKMIDKEVKCKVACVSGGQLPFNATLATVRVMSDGRNVSIHCERPMYKGQSIYIDLDPVLAVLKDSGVPSGGYTHV